LNEDLKAVADPSAADHFPYSELHFDYTELLPTYRADLRNPGNERYERFIDLNVVKDWASLSWKQVGKPYEVKNMSQEHRAWTEANPGRTMPAKTSWELFNRSFHAWFETDVPARLQETRRELMRALGRFAPRDVRTALFEAVKIRFWNYAHRIQDGIWDPRGKRALFLGLPLHKPRILFLGAAEGYEAMQLSAMYPGGEAVLVDYDPYCKTHRFAEFPDRYPFLGANPATGAPKVWYKEQMNLHYLVSDIRSLPFGKEFDIVLSVGLLEHFPDELKPEVMDWHRKFLKPGGFAVMTTPRNQLRARLFYRVMEDVMNHTYRELMTVPQMGLYVYENGFDIRRHGVIKAHNGIIAQPR
jgi:SAM-dependent methyltransferase